MNDRGAHAFVHYRPYEALQICFTPDERAILADWIQTVWFLAGNPIQVDARRLRGQKAFKRGGRARTAVIGPLNLRKVIDAFTGSGCLHRDIDWKSLNIHP